MKTIRIAGSLLLGVALVTGCDDRTPAASGAPLAPAAMVLGQIDPGHPYVGAVIFDTPSPSFFPVQYQPWYCSGTLVSSRVVQTAGHCLAFAALSGGFATPNDLPTALIHVSFAQNVTNPRSWRTVSGYVYHPDFVAPFSTFDVALVFLSQPVNDIKPGTLPPTGYLDSFNNAELQALSFSDVGYGTLGADDNFALTGDRRIATAGFKQLDADFLNLEPEPGGACYGDSGGPILLNSGGVEYVVATLHGVRTQTNSNVKQDCTGDFFTQRLDLKSVLDFIQSNIAPHRP